MIGRSVLNVLFCVCVLVAECVESVLRLGSTDKATLFVVDRKGADSSVVKLYPLATSFDAERTALRACTADSAVKSVTPKLIGESNSNSSRALVVQPRCATTLFDAPFSMRLFVAAVDAALAVLSFFHDKRGVVHGDISPSNALVPVEDGDVVLWNDFGGSVKIGSSPICFTPVFASLNLAPVCSALLFPFKHCNSFPSPLLMSSRHQPVPRCLWYGHCLPLLLFRFANPCVRTRGRVYRTIGRRYFLLCCISVIWIHRTNAGICRGRPSPIALPCGVRNYRS